MHFTYCMGVKYGQYVLFAWSGTTGCPCQKGVSKGKLIRGFSKFLRLLRPRKDSLDVLSLPSSVIAAPDTLADQRNCTNIVSLSCPKPSNLCNGATISKAKHATVLDMQLCYQGKLWNGEPLRSLVIIVQFTFLVFLRKASSRIHPHWVREKERFGWSCQH